MGKMHYAARDVQVSRGDACLRIFFRFNSNSGLRVFLNFAGEIPYSLVKALVNDSWE